MKYEKPKADVIYFSAKEIFTYSSSELAGMNALISPCKDFGQINPVTGSFQCTDFNDGVGTFACDGASWYNPTAWSSDNNGNWICTAWG